MHEHLIDAIGTGLSILLGDIQKKKKYKIVTILSNITIVGVLIFFLFILFFR